MQDLFSSLLWFSQSPQQEYLIGSFYLFLQLFWGLLRLLLPLLSFVLAQLTID